MEEVYLKVKRLSDKAKLPIKVDEDAGYDIYGVFEEEFQIVNVGDIVMIPTKISIEIPKNWVFYIAERGSTGSKGLSRRCGIIDSGYRGEIFIALNNTSNKTIVFGKMEDENFDEFLTKNNLDKNNVTFYPMSKAIAQGILFYCPHVEVEEVHGLSESIRGEGKLGSSGK